MPRRDQLAECNTEREAIPVFQEAWCRRCINPECTRSLYGQSRFDLRVNSWEERLFRNPPRMDASDPRFQQIAGKRFLSLDVGPAPEVRSWVDPSQVQAPTPNLVADPTPVSPVREVSAPNPPPKPEPALVVTEPKPIPANSPKEILLMNTPNQGGRMLPGAPTLPNPPGPDAWSAPKPAENVIPVGGRVKLKGSGV